MTKLHIAHVRSTDQAIQPLEDHLRGVADRSRAFATKVGLAEQGELIGLLHDLGKYSSEFQAYLKSAAGLLRQDEDEEFVDAAGLRGRVDHSTAGAQLIWRDLSSRGSIGQITGQLLALCVASHHSGMINCLSSDSSSLGEDIFTRRMNKVDTRTHLEEVLARVDRLVLARSSELLTELAIVETLRVAMTRIVQASDGMDDKSLIVQQQFGLLVRFLFSCLIDADRIDSADFERPSEARHRQHGQYASWDRLIARLENHLRSKKQRDPIDHRRAEISEHCSQRAADPRGIFTLTVPTGGGKTLASLRFALHHAKRHSLDRVFYIVPFTTIIDQNAEVVRGILESGAPSAERVVLEHHSNLTPERQGWREKILSENWDAPVVFTTTVQLLETLFGAGTRGARRMHQLANSVVIFDEIQALPVKCAHLFNNAVNFLVEQCGSSVLLCTATQPLLDRVDRNKGAIRLKPESELMPDVAGLFEGLRRVEVIHRREPGGWVPDKIAALAIEQVQVAGSCLIVVNTKEAAQSLYRLCAHRGEHSAFHLSTNMCPAHRKEALGEIKQHLCKKKPVLCVSTQLIEAGVDLDFGSVVRFEAGLDSIAQAAGRCNRHGRRASGTVFIVNPRDERLDMLREIEIGREKAQRVLADFAEDPVRFDDNPIGPKMMNWFYENYFLARADDMAYPVSSSAVGHDDTLLNLLSTNAQAVAEHRRREGRSPEIYLRQSFMAAARAFQAIDAPTQGVVVQHGRAGRELIADLCGASSLSQRFHLLRRAQQFTVNVFPHVLAKLRAVGAVHAIEDDIQILYVDEPYYSKEFGLVTEPVAPMEALIA